jgi:hypothetical protein
VAPPIAQRDFPLGPSCVLTVKMRLLSLLLLLAATPAAAEEAHAFAFVVGANRGGESQGDLRYAEEDARRVAEVVTALGRYPAGNVRLLIRPTRNQVLAGLDALARDAGQARAAGAEVRILFYYSGHARANALSLGDEELPLAELRQRLLALPATLTIATLDACQSGSFSRIKGAEPTADFSFNTVNRLTTAGIAVMASSSATELSQESEQLRSSYFTHHLLVGLRGAGDADRDGRVTLAEAYRYAYNRTLVDTAATAVGSQHATLELGLRGKGEVVLTYPAEASSRLELSRTLTGDILIHRESGESVVAEIHKVAGEPMALALPPGRYVALYRRDRDIRRCTLVLDRGSTALDVGRCSPVETFELAAKGAEARETWALELGIGASRPAKDRYHDRLGDFGFHEHLFLGVPRLSLALVRSLRHIQLGAELVTLDTREYRRPGAENGVNQDEHFKWSTFGLGAFARAGYPLLSWLTPYAQLGFGLSLARSSYQEVDSTSHAVTADDGDTFLGYWVKGAVGLSLMPWRHVGFFVQSHLTFAPTVKNRIGDVHDDGGFFVMVGMRGVR